MQEAFTKERAQEIGNRIGILWDHATFSVEEFRKGLDVELEHGSRNPLTDVTGDDPELTGKIVWAHLIEAPDYYERLARMESEADVERALELEQPVEPRAAAMPRARAIGPRPGQHVISRREMPLALGRAPGSSRLRGDRVARRAEHARVVSLRSLGAERARYPLDEVPDGGLGHTVEQRSVDRLPESSVRWRVHPAHGQVTAARSEGRELKVTLHGRQGAVVRSGGPSDRHDGSAGDAQRLAHGDLHELADVQSPAEAHLGQQVPAMLVGLLDESREPGGRVPNKHGLRRPERQIDVLEGAHEHAMSVRRRHHASPGRTARSCGPVRPPESERHPAFSSRACRTCLRASPPFTLSIGCR